MGKGTKQYGNRSIILSKVKYNLFIRFRKVDMGERDEDKDEDQDDDKFEEKDEDENGAKLMCK